MAIDLETLAAARSYVDETAQGLGAIQGKNCTIDSIVEVDNGHEITFSWTLDDGTSQTETMTVENGFNPSIAENPNNTDDDYRLDITTSSGVFTTQNLKGKSGGSGKIERTDLTAVTVGGLNSGSSVNGKTVQEILEAILFPYQKPVMSFSIAPSTTVYESGNTVSSINFSISITKKSNEIQSIKIYDRSTLLTTITSDVANGGTFTYSYACSITSNTTLKVEVYDGTSTVSASKTISFVNKSYYGFVSDGTTVDETVIKSLQNSIVKTVKALTYSGINCTESKIVYAYPKSFGLLSSILDDNGFGYIDSYSCTTVAIDGVDYYVYVMNDATTVDDFKQKFA